MGIDLRGVLAVFVVLAAAAAVALPPNSTPYSDGRPPARYQGGATVMLQTTDQAGINSTCQALFGAPPAGMKMNACNTGERIVMPNPCDYPNEAYAKLLCHELGHANGWPMTHGDDPALAAAESPVAGASRGPAPKP